MRFPALGVCVVALGLMVGCGVLDDRPLPVQSPPFTAGGLSNSAVYTPARATLGAVVNDFLGRSSNPVQPIDFPHDVHIAKGLTCVETCHASATTGPEAGLPSINTCMTCHAAIATDAPRIQAITAMADRGRDLAWQRVFGYPASAHVKFNHAPHIRANVECATCHGDIAHQTVAQRNVVLGMGDCVTCHREKHASNDCVTCHY